MTSISETVTTFFAGGPNKSETANAPALNAQTGDVTFSWSAVEGGTYRIDLSSDLSAWTARTPNLTVTNDSTQIIDNAAASNGSRFYRTTRLSLAPFDSNGFNYK